MDESKKKNLQNIIILVVLLVIMGVTMSMMLGRQSGGGGAATEAAPSGPTTAMASAGITDEMRARAGGTTSVPSAASSIQQLNPNMWRVFSLSPPKNPFVRQESWYADTFRKLLPGYPQLKNGGFFDEPTEVLPDLNALFGAGIDFEYADLSRDFPERNYTLQGVSEDGKMNTVITGVEKRPENLRLTFDPDGNIIDKEAAQRPTRGGGAVDGDDGTRINGIDFGGLPPLGGMPGAAGGQGGNAMAVHGVSIHSGSSSALVMLNGVTRIVNVGDDLTAQYAVSKITAGGVEVKDTKSGETKFIELRDPSDADKNPPASMMRGMNL